MARSRRLETAALLLPVFGALLFVPPLLGVFNIPVTIVGIPVVAIYLFSVWLGLIGATFVLSRRLGRGSDNGGENGGEVP
jgi:hypothetical protein